MIKKEESHLTYKEKLSLEETKHKNNMEELAYFRETERLKHEWELERQRIKSAEIRKNYMRKEAVSAYKY